MVYCDYTYVEKGEKCKEKINPHISVRVNPRIIFLEGNRPSVASEEKFLFKFFYKIF